jgi:hypothetical protein
MPKGHSPRKKARVRLDLLGKLVPSNSDCSADDHFGWVTNTQLYAVLVCGMYSTDQY